MEQPSRCWIDEFGPIPIIKPQSVSELRDVVRRAAGAGEAIYPVGGQTMLGLGLPPTKPGTAVDLRGLARVIDYPARDMTITVQAGITVAKLQELLATENQRLPVDVPMPARATLGGALSVNVSGPRRYGYGTLRDYLIGFSAINDEGQEIKAGGRVVKNVAGYDLCKLFVGALGTLGIITQATLKLRPRPECQALVVIGFPGERLDFLLDQLHASATRPVCLDLLNRRAAQYINRQMGATLPEQDWALVVGFEDSQAALSWQVQHLITEIGTGWAVDARAGSACDPLWQALVELRALPEAALTFKANLLPHAVGAFCRLAASLPEELIVQAHAGNGIVIGHAMGNPGDLAQAGMLLNTLHESAAAAQGNLVILHCPLAWKAVLPVWGRPRGDVSLMHAVKESLNPRRIFNPGRFLPLL
jgi:glycolate oxidase FAD binding subunit